MTLFVLEGNSHANTFLGPHFETSHSSKRKNHVCWSILGSRGLWVEQRAKIVKLPSPLLVGVLLGKGSNS